MKKMLLVGKTGSGKTSLIQRLQGEDVVYRKTQAITFKGLLIDSPGEYLENRRFYSALLISSVPCDVVGLVQDSTGTNSLYPPKFASMFNKKVVGIVTKIDKAASNPARAEKFLQWAGAGEIIRTSVIDNTGLDHLRAYLGQDQPYGV